MTKANTASNETSAWCLEIWAAAHLLFMGFLMYWTATMGAKPEAEAHAESVPMSVGYLIIRVGEWTMVMLGETVLSMLGIPLESDVIVYFMFACSMLIAGNLQFQGYTVHPIHATHHVLQGGQFSFKGLLYLIWATIWYATILVCVGTGAKVFERERESESERTNVLLFINRELVSSACTDKGAL